MLNYNERIILTEQYFTTGQQPEWTNLINKESGTTYYNVSIVTPTLRMNHILHNRPTINMKAIQCSTTQYSVRLLYILFCLAALIDSPPNCHWPSLEVTFVQSGHSPTQDIYSIIPADTWVTTYPKIKQSYWHMAYGSAELPLCVHFGTKQSKTFALTSLEKECGFHGKPHINWTNLAISCSELIPGRRQTDKDTPLCINNTLV